MCNTSLHHRGFNNVIEPFSFSTFHLLRTCNRLMLPNADPASYYDPSTLKSKSNLSPNQNLDHSRPHIPDKSPSIPNPAKSPILDVIETENDAALQDIESNLMKYADHDSHEKRALLAATPPLFRSSALLPNLNVLPLTSGGNKSPLPAFEYIAPTNHVGDFPLMELNRVGVFPAFLHRRSRGEKRPIPEEQKDEKYYERRKRNNEAAKKSRDARKIREDRIAFRAALLEQENSLLRAQIMALRDELQTMRQLINTSSGIAMSARNGNQL